MADKDATPKPNIRQRRSPNYPADGLKVALDSATKLYGVAKQVPVDPKTAARAIGYNALHGPARSRLSALKKYGLISELKDNSVQLTPLALKYLLPQSPEEMQEAVDRAGLMPPLFREIYPLKDASDDVLKSRLVRSSAFSEAGATQAIKAFRDTMALVKALPEGYASLGENDLESGKVLETGASPGALKLPPPPTGKSAIWQQSGNVGPGLMFDLRLVGDSGRKLRPSELDRLQAYLKLAVDGLKDEVEDDEP